jgi:hypothetical protein
MQADEGQRAHAGGDEERVAKAEVRGDVTARRRAPMATLKSCAPCTRPIATGTFSFGQDTLASAIAKTEKPAMTPLEHGAVPAVA